MGRLQCGMGSVWWWVGGEVQHIRLPVGSSENECKKLLKSRVGAGRGRNIARAAISACRFAAELEGKGWASGKKFE